jgi:RNA polymerase sigma-70 factor (ECF subfamily)
VDPPSLRDRLRAGDARAFDEVYAQQRPGLFRYLARLCQEQALAEELSQEVWLRFASHAHTLPDEVELAAWLFSVARNLYRSQRRRQRLAGRWFSELARSFVGAQPSSPFEALAASQAELDLERALASLAENQREILLLVAVESLTPAQAASVLNIRPDAARQRLARAREQLARALGRMRAPLAAGGST